MEAVTARSIATYTYLEERDRFGDPVIEHAARVAAAVMPEARAVAWLHDALEVGGADVDALRKAGLSEDEQRALELLTRTGAVGYEDHILCIAYAPGDAGRLARAVKLADLDDHLAHDEMPSRVPPYAWARRHIAVAMWRRREIAGPGARIAV
jgi:hypothetical protein